MAEGYLRGTLICLNNDDIAIVVQHRAGLSDLGGICCRQLGDSSVEGAGEGIQGRLPSCGSMVVVLDLFDGAGGADDPADFYV
jgi:hypothetical protein